MITCQVDAKVSGMGQEEIGQELLLLGEVLAALDGELLSANADGLGSLIAYVRAESEMLIYEVFEASRFIAERIAYLGPPFGGQADFGGRQPSVVR